VVSERETVRCVRATRQERRSWSRDPRGHGAERSGQVVRQSSSYVKRDSSPQVSLITRCTATLVARLSNCMCGTVPEKSD